MLSIANIAQALTATIATTIGRTIFLSMIANIITLHRKATKDALLVTAKSETEDNMITASRELMR
jgi:hypothetical protein